MNDQPTHDQCTTHASLCAHHGEYAFAAWHPQWGGYGGHARVTFDRVTGATDGSAGCFSVENWHDGEFPRDDETTLYHYCDAAQLIRFGITVLEQQAAHQKQASGEPVRIDRLDDLVTRLLALAGRAP